MKINNVIYRASTDIFKHRHFLADDGLLSPYLPEIARRGAGRSTLGFSHLFPHPTGHCQAIRCGGATGPLPARPKEWAYAGFAFTLTSATIGHFAVDAPITSRVMPLFLLAVLAASCVTYHWRIGIGKLLSSVFLKV